MSQNYDFLRSFTIDGKETKHLFQIAKLNIPFLSKENEFFQVGNTDGKKFRHTRLGDYALSIDGFIIKDNTGKTVPQVMDELKALVNSDEPQKLVFDIFPDRYFNAIFSGVQEYDATDLRYTPLTLVFDVPDGLAHQLEPNTFTNVYSTSRNLILDPEYQKKDVYLHPGVKLAEEKHNGSSVVYVDYRDGIPYEGSAQDEYVWLPIYYMNMRKLPELQVGQDVNFSIEAKVLAIDEDDDRPEAGNLVLEEWSINPSKRLRTHFINIPKEVGDFKKYGKVIKITDPNTKALNVNYGITGLDTVIHWSKPMLSLLPPIGETVTAPSVGAKAYSNSTDFGDYDYSGNPNLSANLDASCFSRGSGATVLDEGDEIVFTLDGTNQLAKYSIRGQTSLVEGKEYTISCEIMLESDFVGDPSGIRLQHAYFPGGVLALRTDTVPKNELNTWQTLIGTRTIDKFSNTPTAWYPLFRDTRNLKPSGKVRLRNIKIEEGSTATPFQPNLLDAPYYLSKVALGENIADPTVKFPISSSSEEIYSKNALEDFVLGETYTVTIGAAKPVSQTIRVYLAQKQFSDFKPVEGLVDTWVATVSITQLGENAKGVYLFQTPNTSLGSCTIKWLKIEKGDTRTPNISEYKYFGEGLKDSNNPNDYSWDVTPEYAEKGLNNAVNVYDPQRVEGLKNFADGIQIAGDKVISENDCTVYTLTKDNSQSFIDGYATFIKHGKEVIVNGTVKLKKAYPFGTALDDVLPAEFIARIVHGMLTGPSGTNSVSKAMYVQKDLGTIMTNSEFAANEWFTFNGHYWVGEE